MIKVKEIRKEGKNLYITIKKPYFMSIKEFMSRNYLTFKEYEYVGGMVIQNFNWKITKSGDIQLNFILRNYDDIKPYIKYKDENPKYDLSKFNCKNK